MRRVLPLVVLLGLLTAACGGRGRVDAGSGPGRPSTTVAGQPTTVVVGPSTTRPASPTTTDVALFAGIWPFATRAELDAYAAGPDKTYRDPVVTARNFATKYLGMDNPVDFMSKTTGPGMVEVPIGPRYSEGHTPLPNPQATFGVVVRQLGAQGASGPWTVVEATAFNISLASPRPLEKVASPVRLTGQALAFEGNVSVQVREDGMLAGQSLGKGNVTGGGDAKRAYSGDITFRSPTKPGGAIVLFELSAADGQGILRATVVKVRF